MYSHPDSTVVDRQSASAGGHVVVVVDGRVHDVMKGLGR